MGYGVRNLFKYSKYYSGMEPEFREGDVFHIIVPLDDAYFYDYGTKVRNMTQVSIRDRVLLYCKEPRKNLKLQNIVDLEE